MEESQMTTLHDLVHNVETADVVDGIVRFYGQREKEWWPDAVADVLGQLRNLTPDPASSQYQLSIELTPPIDPEEQPFWDVSCAKEGDPDRCGLDLSPWEEWLAIRVPQSLLEKMTPAEIVCHCVWEMTFYGFTQEKIAAFRTELLSDR
jgi:hypothetical protein